MLHLFFITLQITKKKKQEIQMSQNIPANAPSWDVFNLSGLVAVITGGGSGESGLMCWKPAANFLTLTPGLGLMFAKALEANGASKVYIIGRNWQKLEAASKQAVRISVRPSPIIARSYSFSEEWQNCGLARGCHLEAVS